MIPIGWLPSSDRRLVDRDHQSPVLDGLCHPEWPIFERDRGPCGNRPSFTEGLEPLRDTCVTSKGVVVRRREGPVQLFDSICLLMRHPVVAFSRPDSEAINIDGFNKNLFGEGHEKNRPGLLQVSFLRIGKYEHLAVLVTSRNGGS